MVNIELPGPCPGLAELRLVVNALETLGIGDAMITGGCLRDAFYGRQQKAKDIDIAVWGLGRQDIHVLYDMLHEAGFVWAHTIREWNQVAHTEPSDADAERIDRVWQVVSPTGMLVDILVYADQFTSWQQVVLSHDHSINMFAAMLSQGVDGYDVDVWFPWHNMGRCYQMRDHVNGARVDHMRDICQELGVVYCITPEPHMEVNRPRVGYVGHDLDGNPCTLTLPYRGR